MTHAVVMDRPDTEKQRKARERAAHVAALRERVVGMQARVKDYPYGAECKKAINEICGAYDHAMASVEGVKSDEYLNDLGRRQKMHSTLTEHLSRLHDASRYHRHGTAQVIGRRKDLGKPELKDSVMATLERQEVRQLLREERDPMKKKLLALELVEDKAAAEAILSGTSLKLTGLTPNCMAEVKERYLKTHFAEEKSQIDNYEENLKSVGAALQIAQENLRNAADFDEMNFGALLKLSEHGGASS